MTERDASYVAARGFSDDVASLLGLSNSCVFDGLALVPSNLRSLLDSPEGWSALAVFVADHLGTAAPAYAPTIH